MRKKKKMNVSNKIAENIETITKNTEETNKKLDSLITSKKSTLAKIITIVAFISSLVAIGGFTIKDLLIKIADNSTPQYEIYLSSEYSKLEINAHTDIQATLNFNTNAVTISAYLNSAIDGDILKMKQKNENQWHKKVYFEHSGTYTIIATATAPNGEVIKGYTEIEVRPSF